MGVIFKRMAGVMPRASAALSRMNAVMVEYVRGMRVIKALNMGSKSFRRFQPISALLLPDPHPSPEKARPAGCAR